MSKIEKALKKAGSGKTVGDKPKGLNPASLSAAKGVDVGSVPKRITKKAQLIELLQTKGGVTIAEISKRLDWQQHTTRAALTGLRKAGFAVSAAKPDGGRAGHYSMVKNVAS